MSSDAGWLVSAKIASSMAWWRRTSSLRCESIDMGQLPHSPGDEIVTQLALHASSKIAPPCEIPAPLLDILGEGRLAASPVPRKGLRRRDRRGCGRLRARRAWRRMREE